MTPSRIAVVDDEPGVCELCSLYLRREGFHVDTIHRGDTALELLPRLKPDLIILDIMLPGADGWEVCRRLREREQTPIIMLTARDEDDDRIAGLDLGADDYLVKPFNPRELVARVRAVLRRANRQSTADNSSSVIRIKGITLDVDRHEVFVDGKQVHLTPKEFDLLHCLMQRPGKTFTRDELLERVWGYDYFGDDRTIDVHVKRLRAKIEPGGEHRYIQTVWGVGYRFGA